MGQCRGETTRGARCRSRTVKGTLYCKLHKKTDWLNDVVFPGAGALVGAIVVPGVGGAIGGTVVGKVLGIFNKKSNVSKARAYICFDYDNDVTIKEFLVGQAKNSDSPFEIADWSIKTAVSGDWKKEARSRIRSSDQVIVICGQHTDSAQGVNAEIDITQDEGKPYFLLKGYKEKTCKKPNKAKQSDKVYDWTWDNLKTLIGGGR